MTFLYSFLPVPFILVYPPTRILPFCVCDQLSSVGVTLNAYRPLCNTSHALLCRLLSDSSPPDNRLSLAHGDRLVLTSYLSGPTFYQPITYGTADDVTNGRAAFCARLRVATTWELAAPSKHAALPRARAYTLHAREPWREEEGWLAVRAASLLCTQHLPHAFLHVPGDALPLTSPSVGPPANMNMGLGIHSCL